MYKVKEKLHDLIPELFLDLVLNVEMGQRELQANAKLEAALKKKKTLDLAKALEEDQAAQNVVAPENMKDLVNSLVDKRVDPQSRQKSKELLKAALKEARKKSTGGVKAANTSPGKHGHGGTQKGNSKQASSVKNKPPPKRAKKQNTTHPERDYREWERQQQNPNLYATNKQRTPSPRGRSPSGRGYYPGRGRGQGQNQGGFSSGRGRGRGRS